MLSSETASEKAVESASTPAIILRGTSVGLEIVVDPDASADAIGEALVARLEQSPGFFAGNAVSVRIDGRLPAGALARLEEVTARYAMHIAEVGAPRRAQTAPAVAPASAPAAPAEGPPVAVPVAAPVADLDPQPLHPLPVGWEG